MAKKPVSKNISRLNEDIRRELIDIIGSMKDPRLKAGMLTVTRVETAPDLSSARVFVSVLGEAAGEAGNAAEGTAARDVVAALDRAKGHVRSEIAQRMHIRRAPEFLFVEDDNAAYADHINKMLKDLDSH